MSPHAIPLESLDRTTTEDLRKLGVTRNAFLPEEQPCQLLDSYYQPWELIAQHLPTLIDEGQIRDAVQRLPVLSTDGLRNEAEWRRAYVMLAYMTHAYVWGGDKPQEVGLYQQTTYS